MFDSAVFQAPWKDSGMLVSADSIPSGFQGSQAFTELCVFKLEQF